MGGASRRRWRRLLVLVLCVPESSVTRPACDCDWSTVGGCADAEGGIAGTTNGDRVSLRKLVLPR